MKNRPFNLYLSMALSSVLFVGCEHQDIDTTTYVLTKGEVIGARVGNSGIKIIDVSNGEQIPEQFLVMACDDNGGSLGGPAFKGMRKCPPLCLANGAAATSDAARLTSAPLNEYPAENLRTDKGIVISSGILDNFLKDTTGCVQFISISSMPGGSIKVMAVHEGRDADMRKQVAYP
jgi:hypothetical protein